ncbi:MAG: hypothetical protein ACR2F1_07920 [Nitrososphaeraceae archaeon]
MVIYESKETLKARAKLREIFNLFGFEVEDEKPYPCVNNMGEIINPPYQADLHVKLEFNLEIDPHQGHTNSKHNIVKDEWKDENIFQQHGVKTVRVTPKDVNRFYKNVYGLFAEIHNQLEDFHNDNKKKKRK